MSNHTPEQVKQLAQDILIVQNNTDGKGFEAFKAKFNPQLWEEAALMATYWKKANWEDALTRSKL